MQEKIYPSSGNNTDIVWSTEGSWAKQIPQTQHSGTPSRDGKQAGNLMAGIRIPPKRKPSPPLFLPRLTPPVVPSDLIFVFSEFYYSNISFHNIGEHIELPYESNRPRLQLLEDIIKPAKSFKKLELSSLRRDGDTEKLYPWEIKFFNWLYSQKFETSFKRFCGLPGAPSPSGGKIKNVIKVEPCFVPIGDYSKRGICLPVLFSDYNLEAFLLPEKTEYVTGTIDTNNLTDIHDYIDTEPLRFPEISKHFKNTRIPITDSNLVTWDVDLEAKTINQRDTYVFNYKEYFVSVYFEHCFPEVTDGDYEDPLLVEVSSADDSNIISFFYLYGTHIPARQITQEFTISNHRAIFAGMKGRILNNKGSKLFMPNQRVYEASLGEINPDDNTIQVTILGSTKQLPTSYIQGIVPDSGGMIYIEFDWSLTYTVDT